MLNFVEHHKLVSCVMLKLQEALTIDINVENSGEKNRLAPEREAQETRRTNVAEETAQSL